MGEPHRPGLRDYQPWSRGTPLILTPRPGKRPRERRCRRGCRARITSWGLSRSEGVCSPRRGGGAVGDSGRHPIGRRDWLLRRRCGARPGRLSRPQHLSRVDHPARVRSDRPGRQPGGRHVGGSGHRHCRAGRSDPPPGAAYQVKLTTPSWAHERDPARPGLRCRDVADIRQILQRRADRGEHPDRLASPWGRPRCQRRGSTGSDSRASTPNTASWIRHRGSPATSRSTASRPRAYSRRARDRLRPRLRSRSRLRFSGSV